MKRTLTAADRTPETGDMIKFPEGDIQTVERAHRTDWDWIHILFAGGGGIDNPSRYFGRVVYVSRADAGPIEIAEGEG